MYYFFWTDQTPLKPDNPAYPPRPMTPSYQPESSKPNSNNGYNNNQNPNNNYGPNGPNYNQGFNQNVGGSQSSPPKQPYVYPQINPTYPVNPIPGSQSTAIGVYPPRPIDTELAYPNFSVAISRWPFYALPFPFNLENIADINASLGGGGSGGTGSSGYPATLNPTAANCNCNKTDIQQTSSQQTPSAQIVPTSGNASPQNYYNQPNGNPNQHPGTYGGIIGFIPIVFFPAPCQPNAGAAYPLFPEAFPFQQNPCTNCGTNHHQHDQPAGSAPGNTKTTNHNEQRRARKAKIL